MVAEAAFGRRKEKKRCHWCQGPLLTSCGCPLPLPWLQPWLSVWDRMMREKSAKRTLVGLSGPAAHAAAVGNLPARSGPHQPGP